MCLKGTPAFMSVNVLNGDGHVHSLNDDLESFIYVVLYAALRWLPVESPAATLDWWISDFFSAPKNQRGSGGGADMKLADFVSRKYTKGLHSTESSHVVDWIKNAMDLHFGKVVQGMVVRALPDDGKALAAMWEGVLAKDLPSNDRRVNPIPDITIREGHSLHATFTVATSMQNLYRICNDPVQSQPPPSPPPTKKHRTRSPQPSELSPKGKRARTRSMAAKSDTQLPGASPEGSMHTSP